MEEGLYDSHRLWRLLAAVIRSQSKPEGPKRLQIKKKSCGTPIFLHFHALKQVGVRYCNTEQQTSACTYQHTSKSRFHANPPLADKRHFL